MVDNVFVLLYTMLAAIFCSSSPPPTTVTVASLNSTYLIYSDARSSTILKNVVVFSISIICCIVYQVVIPFEARHHTLDV